MKMPRPTSFGKDTGLQVRMTVTLFLLGVVYVVFVGAFIAAGVSAVPVLAIAGGLAALNLFASDKLALAAMGARVVTPQEAPQLHAMIDRLCVQADLPKPKVAVANTRMPNAFALGRSPKKATVCATTGIMELLSPAELEGVMAHELTHVANRDVAVMTLAGFFATLAAYIVQFGFLFGGGGSYGDDDDNPSFLVLLLVSLVVYVVSFLLMQALSRYREFAADRGASIITGRPSALASALQKISAGMHRIPQKDLRAAGELQAFFIFPAAKGKVGGLFATHPPMEKRIEALQRLEMQLQGSTTLVGFLDVLRGKRELKQPAPDRLFAMSTAYVKLEMELGLRTTGQAAIVFQPLATADFEQLVRDMEELVRSTGSENQGRVESSDDEHGYRWMIITDPEDFDDLVVGVNAVSNEIQGGGYGDRILAAVFAFKDEKDRPLYWIYNYKRGAFYPFVPSGGEQQRDNEREMRLRAQIGADLPVEAELERWFPLWGIPI